MGTISVDIDVDIDDILYAMSKKERAELSRVAAEDGIRDAAQIIRDACIMIRRGESLDAARFLEAEFFPKWQTESDCLKKYKAAIAS